MKRKNTVAANTNLKKKSCNDDDYTDKCSISDDLLRPIIENINTNSTMTIMNTMIVIENDNNQNENNSINNNIDNTVNVNNDIMNIKNMKIKQFEGTLPPQRR